MGVDSGEVTSAEAVGSVEGDDLPFGLALTDLGDHFLDVNRAICEIVGRSRADLLGDPYVTIVHPEDWSREKDRRAEVLSGRASTYTVDERYVRADGAVRWVTVRASMAGRRGRSTADRREEPGGASGRRRSAAHGGKGPYDRAVVPSPGWEPGHRRGAGHPSTAASPLMAVPNAALQASGPVLILPAPLGPLQR